MVKILINLLKKISRHTTLRKNCIMMNACHCYPRKWTFFSENLFSYFKSLKASPWYGLKKHFFPKNEERKCHLWRSLKTSNEILKVVFIRLRKIVSVNKNERVHHTRRYIQIVWHSIYNKTPAGLEKDSIWVHLLFV